MITLLLLAVSAQVQDETYKSLAPGDRLEVTFRNGNTLTGTLLAPGEKGTSGSGPASSRGGASVLLFADESGRARAETFEKWARDRGLKPRVFAGPPDRERWAKYGITAVPAVVFEYADGRAQSFPGEPTPESLDDSYTQFKTFAEASSVDYTKQAVLILDISLEYPGLNGTMSVPKDHLRGLRKLQKLDEATMKRLQDEKQRIRDANAKADAERRARDSKRTQDALSAADQAEQKRREEAEGANELQAAVKKAERLEQGLKLLEKFPPPEWGPEKAVEIARKSRTKLPVSQTELEFVENLPLWQEALNYQKEKEKKDGKTEGPKPGGQN